MNPLRVRYLGPGAPVTPRYAAFRYAAGHHIISHSLRTPSTPQGFLYPGYAALPRAHGRTPYPGRLAYSFRPSYTRQAQARQRRRPEPRCQTPAARSGSTGRTRGIAGWSRVAPQVPRLVGFGGSRTAYVWVLVVPLSRIASRVLAVSLLGVAALARLRAEFDGLWSGVLSVSRLVFFERAWDRTRTWRPFLRRTRAGWY